MNNLIIDRSTRAYLSEVNRQIKCDGDFRCYPEAMTEETYKLLIHNDYCVRQFIDHFRVTKKSNNTG